MVEFPSLNISFIPTGWCFPMLYPHCCHVFRADMCRGWWEAVPMEMGRSSSLQRTRCGNISSQGQVSWSCRWEGCCCICFLYKGICTHRDWKGMYNIQHPGWHGYERSFLIGPTCTCSPLDLVALVLMFLRKLYHSLGEVVAKWLLCQVPKL